MKKWLFLLAIFSLFSCSQGRLVVHGETVTPRALASAHVGSTDPRTEEYYGQRVVIQWDMPKAHLINAYGILHLRFGNREVKEVTFSIDSPSGYYVYPLLGKEYEEKGSIVSYWVEIISNSKVIETWKHQVWMETISFDE